MWLLSTFPLKHNMDVLCAGTLFVSLIVSYFEVEIYSVLLNSDLHGFSRTSCRLPNPAAMIIWPAGKQWAQVCLDSAWVSNPLPNCCYRIRCGKTIAELFGLAVV